MTKTDFKEDWNFSWNFGSILHHPTLALSLKKWLLFSFLKSRLEAVDSVWWMGFFINVTIIVKWIMHLPLFRKVNILVLTLFIVVSEWFLLFSLSLHFQFPSKNYFLPIFQVRFVSPSLSWQFSRLIHCRFDDALYYEECERKEGFDEVADLQSKFLRVSEQP